MTSYIGAYIFFALFFLLGCGIAALLGFPPWVGGVLIGAAGCTFLCWIANQD